MAIRKNATFYDDQYKFWKSFNSPQLFLACAEYMFEDIEPTTLNEQEKVLFESLRVRMDNQKQKANAGAKGGRNSHGGGRPQKQTENNEKTTKEQQKNKQKTSKKQTENKEDKVKVEDKDISISKSISNKLITSNDVIEDKSSFGKNDINELIFLLKQEANNLGIAYDTSKERYFANFILTAKEFGNFCEKIGQNRIEFAINIMKASIHINYWKGICGGPMKIYQNYSDVYNETLKFKKKQSQKIFTAL